MSSIPHPPYLVNFATSGNRRFRHNDLPIGFNNYPVSVARRYPGSENLVWIWRPRHPRVVLSQYTESGGLIDGNGEDHSVELLVRYLQSVFKKITNKARKAVRSVLPLSIPTQLVCFSVDGVTVLAFLWLAKAFLEVICNVGSMVFVSILLIRSIWYSIAYISKRGTNRLNLLKEEQSWNKTRIAM